MERIEQISFRLYEMMWKKNTVSFACAIGIITQDLILNLRLDVTDKKDERRRTSRSEKLLQEFPAET